KRCLRAIGQKAVGFHAALALYRLLESGVHHRRGAVYDDARYAALLPQALEALHLRRYAERAAAPLDYEDGGGARLARELIGARLLAHAYAVVVAHDALDYADARVTEAAAHEIPRRVAAQEK